MTELKTLKDIKSYTVSPIATGILDEKNSDWRWITDVDLRQEAIKWREEAMKGFRYLKIDMNTMKALKTITKDAILKNNCIEKEVAFIDKFFNLDEEDNLTEEDLK